VPANSEPADRSPIAAAPGVGQILAVDIGGTKLAAARVDARGAVLASALVPTHGESADDLFATLTRLIDSVLGSGAEPGIGSIAACGVGCGGPMTAGGETVSPLNISVWRGFPLRARVAAYTGLDTFVDNDAKALALGEGWVGAAQGVRNYLAMVVSTGVGGGLVVDGRLLAGHAGNAGHVGHVVVEPDGRECACGGQGCLEAEASGTAIRAITGAAPADAPAEIRRRTGMLVGRGVASTVALLDLELVLVAGSVALGYGADFFAAANAELHSRARLDFARLAVIRPAGLGASGPLVGAAAVGWRGVGADIGIG
jgi:glucokinase